MNFSWVVSDLKIVIYLASCYYKKNGVEINRNRFQQLILAKAKLHFVKPTESVVLWRVIICKDLTSYIINIINK